MEIDWKKLAIAAGVGFVIAAVAAAFGRVGFGPLVFRSFVGAISFGALAVGADMLMRRYLPELYETTDSADAAAETEDHEDNNIDITLEAENPHTTASELTGDAPSGERDGADSTPADEAADAEPVEELEAVDESSGAASEPSTGGDLPSFDGVENSFDTGGAGADDTEAGAPPASGAATIDIMGDQEDPEVVARAVRTLLKRDQEG